MGTQPLGMGVYVRAHRATGGMGMNLQELKEALQSDATVRAEEQAKTKKELHAKIHEYEDKIEYINEQMVRPLQNRCMALTCRTICVFCGKSTDCYALNEKRKGKCK